MHSMKHLAESVPKILDCFNKVCDVYPLTKQIRLPFGLSSNSTTGLFEMVHYDSWGAFRYSFYLNAHYF